MDKPVDTFFVQLRHLAGKIERECEQYRNALTDRNEEFCAAETVKVISDLKKDVKSLEEPLQTEHLRQKNERRKLDDIAAAADGFINNHLSQKFSELEQYLAQYGYKPYEEEHASKAVTSTQTVAKEDSEDTTCTEDTAVPKTPPVAKPPHDPNRTPRIEDAGISLDTLQYLNSLQKNKPPTNRPASHKPSWSNIPSAFQHNGIICTPSLAKSLNADISYSADLHSALASPVLLSTAKSMPVIEETQPAPSERLQFNSNEASSPESPVFCTPGIKQVLSNTYNKQDQHSDQAHDSNKKHVSVGLFQSCEASKYEQGEPKVPDLTACYDEDEPVEPDLTYSLEALSDMTGVYMISSAKKPLSSGGKPFSTHLVAADNKENATPPEPEMLTDRISRIKVKQEEQPVTDFVPKQTIFNDMPPSPKLFGNYDFLKQ